MGNFRTSYDITIGHEGGYANVKGDKGGETYMGISRRYWPKWRGWKIIDGNKDLKSFPEILKQSGTLRLEVENFYKINFWDLLKLNVVDHQEICNELFDTAVNQSKKTASKQFQEAINLTNYYEKINDIKVDGAIGTKTLTAYNRHKRKENILKTMNILQGEKYIRICRNDSSQRKFFNGWLNRVTV